jgi:glucose/arabinose dehydrogenase
MRRFPSRLGAVLLGLAPLVAPAQPASRDPDSVPTPTSAKPTRGARMDFGPFLTSSLSLPPANAKEKIPPAIAYKSINLKLGNGAYVAFDTDLLRYAAGWTGDWLDLSKTHMTTMKGDVCPAVAGKLTFMTNMTPGVSHGGSLADPRTNPGHPHLGPLPREWAHYSGLYVSGDRIVLAYTAGGGSVLELPGAAKAGDATLFTRTFRVEKTTEPLTIVLADNADKLRADLVGAPAGAKIDKADGGALRLSLPPIPQSAVFMVALGDVDVSSFLPSLPPPQDPSQFTHGGLAHWTPAIETKGQLAVSPKVDAKNPDPPYVVDTLTLPEDNPWSSWMRPGGFDFFADGKSAALCTWSGDVWIVSGIDASLSKLTWKRFATGLYEPLGLKIVKDAVYVLGRDQITRLKDLNGDGEADFYENFNNDGVTGHGYHQFQFGLETDAAGNFYAIVCGAWESDDLFDTHSTVRKISADGSKLEYIGHGFRAPNGLAVGPSGEIVTADNQGHWTPTSRLDYIPPGKTDGFYGFPYDPRLEKTFDLKRAYPAGVPKTYDPPLCWIPYAYDNSSGGPAFVTSDKWGPFKGNILHSSYGKSALFMVLPEVVDGVAQGGVWRFPLTFESGIMRLRFNPADGQLYAAGLRGWQTSGAKDGALQRVRYTGKPVRQPSALHATKSGLSITFTDPLDPATANDAGSYDVEQWQYKWSAAYGSPEYSVENPTKKGHDTVEIKSAKLQPDGRTVELEIPSIRPVMQMSITYKLKSADGHDVEGAIYNTINRLK